MMIISDYNSEQGRILKALWADHRKSEKIRKRYPMTKDEAYPPEQDRIDPPRINAEMNDNVRIQFFFDGESLGTFDCPKNSSHSAREQIANDNGILFFDKFILDDGRVICELISTLYIDEDGGVWKVITKS